jgi:hypothetical protein
MRKIVTISIAILLIAGMVAILMAQDKAESQNQVFTKGKNNVIVQFNGGGDNNKVYIGEKNTLEILVANPEVLQSITIGFGFITDVKGFKVVEGYGSIHGAAKGTKGVLKDHVEAAKVFTLGGVLVNDTQLPDQVLIGGVCTPAPAFPASDEPRLVFSMQIEIPKDAKPAKNGFCIDNIFFPPGGTWEFSDGTDTYVPLFNGRENKSARQPSAPSVCFELAKR